MSMAHFDAERELLSQRAILPYLADESLVTPIALHEVQPTPPTQMRATQVIDALKHLVDQAALPGVQPEDLKITLQGETLMITCVLREK